MTLPKHLVEQIEKEANEFTRLNIRQDHKEYLDYLNELDLSNSAYIAGATKYAEQVLGRQTWVELLEEALKKIADQDFRGIRSTESFIAFNTLLNLKALREKNGRGE